MKKIRNKNIITCAVLSVCVVFQANCVFAKYLLSPSRVEAKVPPGKGFEEKFEFTNSTDELVKVRINVTDRTINPVVSDWLKPEKNIVEIKPHTTETVTYTVSIPEGASGEYNAWFVTEEISGDNLIEKSMASFAVRMSVPIYVMVKGTEKYDFDIKSVAINLNKKPAEINLMVKNTGNVHIRPTGKIIITGVGSPQKFALKFNEIKWGIIPDEQTEYPTKFNEEDKLADGTYKAQITIQAGDEENMKNFEDEIVFEVKGYNVNITQGLGK